MQEELTQLKELSLLLEPLPDIPKDIKLKIAGKFEGSAVEEFIRNEIRDRAPGRVEILGKIPLNDLMDNFSKAAVVFYAPLDEDYGFVSLEGMASNKPIISCKDSGGILEFVINGKTGVVTNPDPGEIAGAVNLLLGDPEYARKLGDNGRALIDKYNLDDKSWDDVVGQLLQTL